MINPKHAILTALIARAKEILTGYKVSTQADDGKIYPYLWIKQPYLSDDSTKTTEEAEFTILCQLLHKDDSDLQLIKDEKKFCEEFLNNVFSIEGCKSCDTVLENASQMTGSLENGDKLQISNVRLKFLIKK